MILGVQVVRNDTNLTMDAPRTTTSQRSTFPVVAAIGGGPMTQLIANRLMMLTGGWLIQITWIGQLSRDSSALWMEQVVQTSILRKWQSTSRRTNGTSRMVHQGTTIAREVAIKRIMLTIGNK